MADPGSVTPDRVDNSIGSVWDVGNLTNIADAARAGGEGTGLTWPPTLPFGLALERARALDRSAMGMLYRRFMPVIYRFVFARVGDKQTAEDITSETFFAVISGIDAMRAQDELAFAAWLLGIARNKVATHYRRAQARPEAPVELTEDEHPATSAESGDPLAVITARESWSEVVAALNRLTEEQRVVVLYRCVLGYSTEDVAHLLEKQPNAIRALQFRALASLARYLKLAGYERYAQDAARDVTEDVTEREEGGMGDATRR